MAQEERETLVALATSGIVNWRETDCEDANAHMLTLQFSVCCPGLRVICAADVYECLAALLCCLTADTPVQHEVFQSVLATVMEWRSSNEKWFLFDRWQDALAFNSTVNLWLDSNSYMSIPFFTFFEFVYWLTFLWTFLVIFLFFSVICLKQLLES